MKPEQLREFLRIRSALTFIKICYNPIQFKILWGQTQRPAEYPSKSTLLYTKQIPIQRTEHEKKNRHLKENIEHLYDLESKNFLRYKNYLKINVP